MAADFVSRVLRAARPITDLLRSRRGAGAGRPPAAAEPQARRLPDGAYPGDYTGVPTMVYAPNEGDTPDPGEVVWAWVPFEEDYAQGKDRPVLVIAWEDDTGPGGWLLGLPLTSQDHDRDAAQEARAGRVWVDIGSGRWDSAGRPSEVRVNRIVRVHPDRIRRIAARLDEAVFNRVARAVERHAGAGRGHPGGGR